MKIKDQTSDGEVLFNIDGRPTAFDVAQAERDDRSDGQLGSRFSRRSTRRLM